MFDCNHYVPILKGKRGEFRALGELFVDKKKFLTPLIDVPRIPLNQKLDIGKHLSKIVVFAKKNWGEKDPIFVDLFDIDLELRLKNGDHPANYVLQEMRKAKVKIIPVTGLERDNEYNNAIAREIVIDQRGACVRILKDDLELIDEFEDKLFELLGRLNISPSETHLIIDFRALNNQDIRLMANMIVSTINKLPNIKQWQTLTIAGSGFPENLINIEPNSNARIPRTEFAIWKLVVSQKQKLGRIPTFGDYGIVYPDLPDLDFSKINPGGKIRYTTNNEWLVFRGQSFKKHPEKWGQYKTLAQKVVIAGDYLGPKFSWGDQYLFNCANGNASTGNLETWVKVDTNHHLNFVIDQISNSPLI